MALGEITSGKEKLDCVVCSVLMNSIRSMLSGLILESNQEERKMNKTSFAGPILSIVAVLFAAVLLVGCPQPGTSTPTFDFNAGVKDTGDDTWALRAYITNPEAQTVTFQLFEFNDDDGQYWPTDQEPTQRFGVVENVTLIETDLQYGGQLVYWFNSAYYYWSSAVWGLIPVPYSFLQTHEVHLTGEETQMTSVNIVRSDGSYLFASFDVGPGNYMIRITGTTDDGTMYQPVEHYFDELEVGDPGDPVDLTLSVTGVPEYGDTTGVLSGTVSGIPSGMSSNYKVVVYLYVDGLYYVKPNYGNQAYTPINADGTWSCPVVTGGVDEFATQYVVYLVENGTEVPMCGSDPAYQSSQPYIPDALAVSQVTRQPVIYGGDGTIEFTSIPLFGDPYGVVHGIVTEVNPSAWRVAVYILVDGVWYLKPDCDVLTPIATDGAWYCDITVVETDSDATDVAAYLVPAGTEVPCSVFPTSTKSSVLKADAPVIPEATSSVAVNRVPLIAFTYVPVYGSDDGTIRGTASSLHLEWYKVVIYIQVAGEWWVKPSAELPLTDINADGQWSTWFIQGGEDTCATEIWAYLVPYWITPPSNPDGLTEQPTMEELEAVSAVWVNRNPGIDDVPPIITMNGVTPLTVEVNSGPYVDPGATAWDNVDGDISGDISTTSTVDMTVVGTYTVTYEVSDAAGNTAVPVVRMVYVVDTTDPVISMNPPDPIYVVVNSGPYVDPGATAWDNYDGDISGSIVTTSTVDMTTVGDYTVTYYVQDSSGNSDTKVRTVHVCEPEDDVPPVITILGDNPLYFEVNSGSYSDPGATALDDVDGDLTGSITASSNVNPSLIGTYSVIYSVTDTAGNTGTATRAVHVVDTTDPVIVMFGDNPLTVEVNSGPYVDPGASASDNYNGDLSGAIVTTFTVDMTTVGDYTVTYYVQDSSGNSDTKVRTVHVVDTTPPVIDPAVGDIELYQLDWTQVDLTGYGSDNYDPSPSWSASGYDTSLITVTFTGEVMKVTALDAAGTTTITLTLTDSSGNSVSQLVNVTVNPCGAPTIEFTYVPEYGNIDDYLLQGEVRCADETQYVVVVYIYVPESGWWIKPDFAPGCYTGITRQEDGHKTWECLVVTGGSDHLATQFYAYLVPVGTTVPQAAGSENLPVIPEAVAGAPQPRPATQ